MSLTIYIDADACPVREETYKVAERHTVPVVVVSNSYIRIPKYSIGAAIATRAIMADLRAGADMPNLGGPSPFSHKDRSRFLEALHLALERRKQR